MRIEAYHKVAQIYKTQKNVPAKKAADGAPASRDEVQISSAGRDYQIAKQAVAEAPDIREERVAELASKVRSGNYDVDVNTFADKLLAKYKVFMI